MKKWERLAMDLERGNDEGVCQGTHIEAAELLCRYAMEVHAVLVQLDGLAKLWGDEGVFRTCRDRLRELVEEDE